MDENAHNNLWNAAKLHYSVQSTLSIVACNRHHRNGHRIMLGLGGIMQGVSLPWDLRQLVVAMWSVACSVVFSGTKPLATLHLSGI